MNGLKPYFLAILVPLVAMVTILSLYFYQKDSVQLAEHIKENELRQLESLIQIGHLHLNTITEDLNRLTYQLQQEPLHEPLRVLEKASVLKQFKSILVNSDLYDSIRLIDYKNTQVLLLNKVKDGFHIDYSKVIEEPQELRNIDHTFSLNNKVSYIYKHRNKVSLYQHLKLEYSNWVVQLSYHQLPVSNIASNKERTNFIINNDAKWITQPYLNKSLNPSGHDNTSSDDVLFSVTYPYLWNAVKRLNKGQTIIGDYLYTYTPLIFSDNKLNKNIDKNTSEWVLVSSLNLHKELNNLYFSNFTRIRLAALYITFFCFNY
ncbi:hypothetical protein [Photobacterium angustum]|uniref:hypothetical protein n=1 Tax=Photobacterium angustum TaxID=661 RepID=UPI000696F204|nr:hypothetical protein [Photobacterium angustum]